MRFCRIKRLSMSKSAPLTNLLLAASLAVSASAPTLAAAPVKPAADAQAHRSLALSPLAPAVLSPHTVAKSPAVTKAQLHRTALKMYPRTHFERGLYFKGKGDTNTALVEFLKSTQENPKMVRAFYEQALIFRERGYMKLAESALEQALAIKRDYQDARILLATIRIQQGNLGGAMQELGRSLGLEVASKPVADATTHDAPAQKSESSQPTVLQSVHKALPEDEARPAFNLRPYPSMERALKEKPATETSPVENSHTESDRSSQPAADANDDVLFGFHFKRLPRLWHAKPAVKEKAPTEEAQALPEPAAPPLHVEKKEKEKEKEKEKPAQPRKHQSKGWLTRFFGANEEKDSAQEEVADDTQSEVQIRQPAKVAIDDADKKAPLKKEEEQQPQEVTEQHALPPLKFQPASAKDIPPSLANKLAFQTPPLPSTQKTLLSAIPQAKQNKEEEETPLSPDDDWSKRLKFLNEHGTATLKDGEAFMFFEDTGEATLFLADGQTIRRIIAQPRDAQEVARQRRPDLFVPEDLMYNLSLLAKLMPKEPEPTPNTVSPQQPDLPAENNFNIDNIMGKSQGFWGWLKKALTLQ